MKKQLMATAFVASLGGTVFGYDLGALSAVNLSLREQLELSPARFGLTVSSSLWGTVCGSLLAGWLADRIGRRKLIAACAALYAVASIGVAIPMPFEWIFVIAMRFVCGVAIGGFTVGCPLYLSEMAPPTLRGRLVSLFQVQVGVGVVAGFCAGSIFSHLISPSMLWRVCLGMGAAPSLLLLALLKFMPQTEAKFTAVVSRGGHEKLFQRQHLRPILLATSIGVFNQLTGVNVVLIYLLDILSSAGIGLTLGHVYTVLISCLGLATTLLGMAFVDKLGRKPLLLMGAIGMATCLVCLGLTIPQHFAPLFYLFILVAYNAFFAFSQGTVVWVYLSELFSPGTRGAGQGYGSSVHWIANAILVFAFPLMRRARSAQIFYVFALMMVLQIGVVRFWYPETRGSVLGQLQHSDN